MKKEYSNYIQKAHWKHHQRRTIESVGEFFLPYIKPGQIGLDAGCGTGSITNSIVKHVQPYGHVIGIDINGEALSLANDLYSNISNLDFIKGDLYSLPFDDNTFDFIFSHGVLIHCEKPIVVLKEFRRVLKVGGVLGVSAVDHDSILIHPDLNGLLKKSILVEENLWKLGSGWGKTPEEKSNLRLGKCLKEILVSAGFSSVIGFARCDCQGEKNDIELAAKQEIDYLSSDLFQRRAFDLSLTTKEELNDMIRSWSAFSKNPSAFKTKIICEAIGFKK